MSRLFKPEAWLATSGLAKSGLVALILAAMTAAGPMAPAFPQGEAPPGSVERERFRWPLRGPILEGFKSGENDGIEIKAPIGEPVHASADGICTYAGDELKTYGKLILVRHADGYVTAYAHLSELMVKEGDKVRRGQIIAKSGGTGAPSPRLHFELRKDGKPVDPTKSLVPL